MVSGFTGILKKWWDGLTNEFKEMILQGGQVENFVNKISFFFVVMILESISKTTSISQVADDALFRTRCCDLNMIKEYQTHMRSLVFYIDGGYHQGKYKVYYIKSFPEFFSKLI